MNAPQRRTVLGLAGIVLGGFVLLVAALVLELLAVRDGGAATISEALWRLWATQPWVVLLSTHAVAGPAWFLQGHFFGQSRAVYDALRAGIDPAAAVELAIEARAALRMQTRQGNGLEPLTVMLSPAFVKALDGPKES